MSRSYRGVRPKAHRVYSVQDVMKLCGISRNTVCNWVRSGLVPVDKQKPQLFRGAELARFHAARRQERPKLRSGEFKCLGCKAVVSPETTTVRFQTSSKGEMFASATCPDCGASLMKRLGKTEYDNIRNCLDTNTSLTSIDEGLGGSPACIGSNQAKPAQTQPSPNDRLIHDWQDYAGRYTEKTVDAHLAAIRSFEAFIQLKPFSKVTTDDAAAWREDVVSSGGGGLSHSTIRHRASHLRAFFEWLGKEAGFRHLAPVPAYFELPRRFHQKKVSKSREYPTLDEAKEMLDAMPTKTLKDRRQRAIFAFAFVGGLRADALITVRRRHVDLARRQITHDGEEMRTKNGKSFVVNWFPRTEHFRQVFIAWFEEGAALGLQPDDALFPDLASLSSARRRKKDPMAPMKTMHEAKNFSRMVLGAIHGTLTSEVKAQ